MNAPGSQAQPAMAGMTPPHGLKPRVELATDWWQVAIIAVAVLLALGVLWLMWQKWQEWRRRSTTENPVSLAATGPGRVAQLVAEIRAIELPQPPAAFELQQREDFFWRLGLAFRTAVEWRTGIGATAQTFAELQGPLSGKLPLPRRETEEALQLLQDSEFIKFAGRAVSIQDAEAARAATIRLISKLFPGEVSTL